jgi:uncharacterized integral membrane protein
MPWRLIGLIIILVILLAFIGFNLDNTCPISFGFTRIDSVPVYITVFASFVLGMLMSVPFLISFAIRKKNLRPKKDKTDKTAETPPVSGSGPYGID